LVLVGSLRGVLVEYWWGIDGGLVENWWRIGGVLVEKSILKHFEAV